MHKLNNTGLLVLGEILEIPTYCSFKSLEFADDILNIFSWIKLLILN